MNARWRPIGIALLFLCARGITSAQPPSSLTGDPVAGAHLFRTRGCVECHGADVARLQQDRFPYALAAAMWNHFPQMADRIRTSNISRPYFTSGEMRDLMTFLYSAQPQEPARPDRQPSNQTGDAKRGEQLVADKGCLACHSISGPGGRRARSLADLKGSQSPWSVVAQMWNHSFLMQLETEGQHAGWSPLTAEEMADLVAFLQALMQAR